IQFRAAERAAFLQDRGMNTTLLGGAAHESNNQQASVCQEQGQEAISCSGILLGLRTLFSPGTCVETSPPNSRSAEQEDPLVAATAGLGVAGDDLVRGRLSRRT